MYRGVGCAGTGVRNGCKSPRSSHAPNAPNEVECGRPECPFQDPLARVSSCSSSITQPSTTLLTHSVRRKLFHFCSFACWLTGSRASRSKFEPFHTMALPTFWQHAWDAAGPRLRSISTTLDGAAPAPQGRNPRVGQLDSELLDQELLQLLREPIYKSLDTLRVRSICPCPCPESRADRAGLTSVMIAFY